MDISQAQAKIEALKSNHEKIAGSMRELVNAGKVTKSLDKEKYQSLDKELQLNTAELQVTEMELEKLNQIQAPAVDSDGLPEGKPAADVTKHDYDRAVQHRWAKSGLNGITSEEAGEYLQGSRLRSPNTPNTCLLYTSPSPRDS